MNAMDGTNIPGIFLHCLDRENITAEVDEVLGPDQALHPVLCYTNIRGGKQQELLVCFIAFCGCFCQFDWTLCTVI